MRLLVVTQVIDQGDPVLGFFCGWLTGLTGVFEEVTVVCLKEGKYTPPSNVRVFSLGKEKGSVSSLRYALRFLRIAWREKNTYDLVLVHMNQEYLLAAGWLWMLLGKNIYLWRNHWSGSLITDIAASFCTKIFCTSQFSYTAKYKKTMFMPIGIDTTIFRPVPDIAQTPRSILFLARLSPSKRADVLVEALGILRGRGIKFSAALYGPVAPEDSAYVQTLQKRVQELHVSDQVTFHGGVPNAETPRLYTSHAVVVNCSRSGMFDKTIFEAAACGSLSLAASRDWAKRTDPRLSFTEGDVHDLATKLEVLFGLSPADIVTLCVQQRKIVEDNSLPTLIRCLEREIKL